jgi:hypothetical protein
MTKVTQALESKKPEDLSAAQSAVKDANAAIRAAPKGAPTPTTAPQNPP